MKLTYEPKKPKLPTRTVRTTPNKAQHNLEGWKWRLVLMLTGGEIEAVPLLPRRIIHATETVVVKLGQEGALNTIGVKVPKVDELVEVGVEHLAPETFVAIDVDTPTTGPRRIVGTVVRIDGSVVHLETAGNPSLVTIAHDAIVRAFWAPMGYRP